MQRQRAAQLEQTRAADGEDDDDGDKAAATNAFPAALIRRYEVSRGRLSGCLPRRLLVLANILPPPPPPLH